MDIEAHRPCRRCASFVLPLCNSLHSAGHFMKDTEQFHDRMNELLERAENLAETGDEQEATRLWLEAVEQIQARTYKIEMHLARKLNRIG